MSHLSPATFLVWAIVISMLEIFLLFHLWSFDRFKCLRWNSGPYSGAFKRVMTYSYLICIPLILTYAVGNAIIKYREGFVDLAFVGIVPKPYELWESSAQRSNFPPTLCFSIAWSLEMVTHLEELCFWLYLVNSTAQNQSWFKTLYFKTWAVGSVAAVIYMPLLTILSRNDHIKSEAYTFLGGSIGSLSLTIGFLPILFKFPTFIQNLKNEGVDMKTIVRLTTFEELNRIRVLFRFLFCVPILILGVDGVRPHDHHINENMTSRDLLTILAAFGCGISSAITLVIFFPRSVENEIAAKEAEKERKRSPSEIRAFGTTASYLETHAPSRMNTYASEANSFAAHGDKAYTNPINSPYANATSSPLSSSKMEYKNPFSDTESQLEPEVLVDIYSGGEERDLAAPLPLFRPNRKRGRDVEFGGLDNLTELNLTVHNMNRSNVNPLVHNFTSPIDIYASEATESLRMKPKYTFKK
ncbi:hypothetical protein AGABI2DRAFT_178530 [Agaricus bisporus var. bisporus H97]|uniref:hypothetical protein n=1 Tax=Agaricus bisporus var. bisporus (strain H97 / ATCC MYA-4626 / FGSC 10389) TaxID=936046 RepID=UPI00029F6A6B|nr:hypothetical protein AGABI2DRAFT_178530 [Agaricus bisporus var. bisporus H97]EKV47674.1 hypothetical protein AGABI2DRAFT_178530 [Agaricus bisporus var. bisporus H97]